MQHRSIVAILFVLLALPRVARASDRDDAEAIQDKRMAELLAQMAVPRIPTRDFLLKDTDGKEEAESTKSGQWVTDFIAKKKAKADAEVEELKKKVQQEDEARIARERERQRRLARLGNFDDLEAIPKDTRPVAVHVKLEFQVPEIETCRRAAEVCKQRKALADDIVEMLSTLDRNNDGKLTGEEYVDACAIAISAAKLFEKIDGNDDGLLSEAEIESAKQLPKDAADACASGRSSALIPNTHIKNFDANNDGVLDAEERKAMSMAFVEIGLKAQQEADFYRKLADSLSVSRDIVATKFADLVITP